MCAGAIKPAISRNTLGEDPNQSFRKTKGLTATALSLPDCSCYILRRLIQRGMAEKRVQKGNWYFQ